MSKDSRILRLQGRKAEAETRLPLGHENANARSKGRVELGAARAAGGIAEVAGVKNDDIACVEYSNGFKLWMRVADMHEAFAVRRSRSAGARSAEVWDIEPRASIEPAQRGVVGLAVDALEIFGVDLKTIATDKLTKWFENKQLHYPEKTGGTGTGLYRLSLKDEFGLAAAAGSAARAGRDAPSLLFIHGTASSTRGSFGRLWQKGNAEGARVRAALFERYGERVWGFEHRSLSESPIDNALALVEQLEQFALRTGADLHLVTHSRGGLIGELLCLAERDRSAGDPLAAARLKKYFSPDAAIARMLDLPESDRDAYAKVRAAQRRRLQALLERLDALKPRIGRFVRVACPARGTTLASGRLDRWLSVLQYLAPDAFGDAIDFLLGMVERRTDPRTLPGLEAQMPGSALIQILNLAPGLRTGADLSVIAGDIDDRSILGRLKCGVLDWFYKDDNDLVVNTGSMYGGIARSEDAARFFLDQGRDVQHFNYFTNATTLKLLQDGLTRADGAMGGYKAIAEAQSKPPAWRSAVLRSAAEGPRPVVIVLPGTMGSELIVDDDKVWLDLFDLACGGLAHLDIAARTRIGIGEPLADFYGGFLQYLSRTHEVVPFAYDWRQSLSTLAAAFAPLLEAKLAQCERDKQPLRIAAHSMGGLVMRTTIALKPNLWGRMRALPGSRFIMFGTPNAGSHEAVRWLIGRNPTLGKLALLDFGRGRDGVLKIISRFPGMLELLPFNTGDDDYTRLTLWEKLKLEVKESWPLPEKTALGRLQAVWTTLRQSPIDPTCVLYVAGCGARTVCRYETVRGEPRPLGGPLPPTIQFYSTPQGDGTVTWASGRLAGVPTWYVEDTEHDELMSNEAAFPAYLELLSTGATARLTQTPPVGTRSMSDAELEEPMPIDMPDSIPGEEDTAGFVLGVSRPRPAQRRRVQRMRLSVRHGDLAYACHPVCVGHYLGDTIVSAEAALDRYLDGALSDRLRLGLYPGRVGSHEVFINGDRDAKPGGAVVVGLGQVGELSPGTLESGIAHAMLEYALQIAGYPDDRFDAGGAPRSARVSMLLIGTGAGNMSVRDSIASILGGVQLANQRLAESRFDERVRIDEVEFVELFHDLAIQAMQALREVLLDPNLEESFDWPESERCLIEGDGARMRVTFEEAAEWWRRLEICHDASANTLRFAAIGARARAEESLVAGQLQLAEDFIATARASTGNTHEIARTLFEMLVPNRLKEAAPDQHDVVLLLDKRSAIFPWELMEDRWGGSTLPLSVSAGLVRQLKTSEFRPRPAHTFAATAYVVGNPLLPESVPGGPSFADLPGARREAEEVAKLLAASGYAVTARIGDTADNILMNLHGEAYRILHLAGHGVHELEVNAMRAEDGRAGDKTSPGGVKRYVSGMVIGEETFLTPADVDQMRWVPELVFVNCCHLARVDAPPGAEAWTRYNALAANLAIQFINMGVKGVVAAGWAIDDRAALEFARVFYRHMLDGIAFGDAVRAARAATYTRYPQSNTWGAYQCYGDPGFRLADGKRAQPGAARPYYSIQQLVNDLENLRTTVRMSADGAAESWQQKIDAILHRIPAARREEWQRRAEVSTALGLLYGEIGDFRSAIEAIQVGGAAERADMPLMAIEQLGNFRARHALQCWQAAHSDGARAARERTQRQCVADMKQAISALDTLLTFGATGERNALLGSAWKRLAWMQPDKRSRMASLEAMAATYLRALDILNTGAAATAVQAARPRRAARSRAQRRSGTEARYKRLHHYTRLEYPFINWLVAETVMSWYGAPVRADWRAFVDALCARAVVQAEDSERRTPTFWNSIVEPNCRLLQALLAGNFDEATRAHIARAYLRAAKRGSSRRELGSVREHLDFLIDMARHAAPPRTAVRKQLEALRAALGQ